METLLLSLLTGFFFLNLLGFGFTRRQTSVKNSRKKDGKISFRWGEGSCVHEPLPSKGLGYRLGCLEEITPFQWQVNFRPLSESSAPGTDKERAIKRGKRGTQKGVWYFDQGDPWVRDKSILQTD